MATCSDTSAAQILLKNVEFRHICLAEPERRKVLHSVMAGEISCLAFVPEDRMTLFKSIAENGTPMFSGVLAGPDPTANRFDHLSEGFERPILWNFAFGVMP